MGNPRGHEGKRMSREGESKERGESARSSG